MVIAEWNTSYAVGIAEFDEHHRHLIDLLNEVYDIFIGKSAYEELGHVLDKLIDYATYHFVAEEHWMGLHGYCGLKKHREEHNRFSHGILEIQHDFYSEKRHLPIETLAFIGTWLIEHIIKSDADYGVFAARRSKVWY